jgi:hypothetical protein
LAFKTSDSAFPMTGESNWCCMTFIADSNNVPVKGKYTWRRLACVDGSRVFSEKEKCLDAASFSVYRMNKLLNTTSNMNTLVESNM